MSKHFEEELQDLNNNILKMGAFAEEAISRSTKALRDQDRKLAEGVIDGDRGSTRWN